MICWYDELESGMVVYFKDALFASKSIFTIGFYIKLARQECIKGFLGRIR